MTERIRIIVAEDLQVLREHFCELIGKETDMEVVGQASSGREVLELVASRDVDLILMDIEMDFKHDGIVTAMTVLSNHPDIKIVFLTVHEDDETVFGAFETGAVDYLLKTSPSSEVVSSIRKAHEGIVQVRPEVAYKIKNEFTRIRRNEESFLKAAVIVSQLTPSELAILELLQSEMKIAEIAKDRQVELSTIKSQINVILKKFNKKRTKEVVALLRDLNLMPFIHKVRDGGEG
ncbi:response regulator transcription factor [Paenibacillus ginsengarvi]|uniref:DNA-binding response regulator n=1 Tax=Paenibacillus ginsengarvi TaxID=400777 RepID=A0A3B0C4Y4_9BACL|nr:response regulator transcription factor [Paenibacillus ginsengarvi]RKN79159.1 DNA-binding response regulator [Paenibacillus ginsengarvi]